MLMIGYYYACLGHVFVRADTSMYYEAKRKPCAVLFCEHEYEHAIL